MKTNRIKNEKKKKVNKLFKTLYGPCQIFSDKTLVTQGGTKSCLNACQSSLFEGKVGPC